MLLQNKSINQSLPINKTNNSINKDEILNKNFGLDENDYKLDFNFNDPSKFSPPNNWTCRLKTRIKSATYNESKNNVINTFIVVPVHKN